MRHVTEACWKDWKLSIFHKNLVSKRLCSLNICLSNVNTSILMKPMLLLKQSGLFKLIFSQIFYFYYLLFNFKKNLTSSNKKNKSLFLSNAKVTTVSGQETHHDHTTLIFLMYTIRKKIVKQVLSLVLSIGTVLLWIHLQKHIYLFLTSDNMC